MRRLLSLDYVLEHPHLPWLPMEPEKVGAVEEIGVERRLLPQRVYRGAAGKTHRYLLLPEMFCASRNGTERPAGCPARRLRSPRTNKGGTASESPQIAPDRLQVRSRAILETFS